MRLEVKLKGFVLLFALMLTPLFINAQTLADAQLAYNAGVTAKTDGNLEEAIAQFNTCVSTCEALVEEEEEGAEDLMVTVQGYIPSLYLQLGSDQIQNKQISEGVINLYKAEEIAAAYGDTDTEAKAEKLITQVHYKLGASKYKAKEYAAALQQLDKALAMDPNFVSAYYLKAVVYKKQANDELLIAASKKGIEVAQAENDTKNEEKIANLANGHFLKKGNDAKSASKYDEAIKNLNTALEFVPTDATALYLLSTTYLAQEKYTDAIEAGEKAVQNEKGGEEAQAKIFMTIAEAQAKNGDTTAACATYKKAAVGQYTESAKWHIETELKCE